MTSNQQIPAELQDVALIDASTSANAAGLSVSHWHNLVRLGQAPAPALRAHRFTRWRLKDVRAWLEQLPSRHEGEGAAVIAQATKASRAAKGAATL